MMVQGVEVIVTIPVDFQAAAAVEAVDVAEVTQIVEATKDGSIQTDRCHTNEAETVEEGAAAGEEKVRVAAAVAALSDVLITITRTIETTQIKTMISCLNIWKRCEKRRRNTQPISPRKKMSEEERLHL